MKGAQGVAGSCGGAHRSRVLRCMLMKSLINFTAHNTPPFPGGGSCAKPCSTRFRGPPGRGSSLRFGRRFRDWGRSPPLSPCPRGPARPLTTCSLLLLRLPFQEAGRLQ